MTAAESDRLLTQLSATQALKTQLLGQLGAEDGNSDAQAALAEYANPVASFDAVANAAVAQMAEVSPVEGGGLTAAPFQGLIASSNNNIDLNHLSDLLSHYRRSAEAAKQVLRGATRDSEDWQVDRFVDLQIFVDCSQTARVSSVTVSSESDKPKESSSISTSTV